MSAVGELRDGAAWLIALLATLAAYAVTKDWRAAAGAGLGTLAVRIVAGVSLSGPDTIPNRRLPGLTTSQSRVAYRIHRNLGDPAIARDLRISIPRVQAHVAGIMERWRVDSREGISAQVGQILRLIRRRPTERWEWIAELGAGIAVMALGVGVMALPPDTPIVGPDHDVIGMVFVIAGLVFGAVSTFGYYRE